MWKFLRALSSAFLFFSTLTVAQVPDSVIVRHVGSTDKFQFLFAPTASWNREINWTYNSESAPAFASVSVMSEIMNRVIKTWSAVCGVKAVYGGTVSTEMSQADQVNVIVWKTFPQDLDLLGYELGTTDLDDPTVIVDADVALNVQLSTSEQTFQLLLHEFGHVIGLNHSDKNGQVMSGPPTSGYNTVDVLQADDIAGCQQLYGPPADSETPITPPLPELAVEFYHAGLDHYFLTVDTDEIVALDTGIFEGWKRTGVEIPVYTSRVTEYSPICRFYIPPPISSHFYSANRAECAEVLVLEPSFIFERKAAMYLLSTDSGECPANTLPIYRVWNHRPDTNHRYLLSKQLRDEMVAKGYVAEGNGPDAVVFCSAAVK